LASAAQGCDDHPAWFPWALLFRQITDQNGIHRPPFWPTGPASMGMGCIASERESGGGTQHRTIRGRRGEYVGRAATTSCIQAGNHHRAIQWFSWMLLPGTSKRSKIAMGISHHSLPTYIATNAKRLAQLHPPRMLLHGPPVNR